MKEYMKTNHTVKYRIRFPNFRVVPNLLCGREQGHFADMS